MFLIMPLWMQALQLTFKEHTSEVHKLQRQIDSLRIKHASEAEKAQVHLQASSRSVLRQHTRMLLKHSYEQVMAVLHSPRLQ